MKLGHNMKLAINIAQSAVLLIKEKPAIANRSM